uniref:Uncharacterized protein n=1 Tax=Methanococcus maripaludis (strain C5 / ATCC BAA-1333) TaxID=402880 RepID=O06102_METM5|nr:unknown [Methanococcus maripaludis C5]
MYFGAGFSMLSTISLNWSRFVIIYISFSNVAIFKVWSIFKVSFTFVSSWLFNSSSVSIFPAF